VGKLFPAVSDFMHAVNVTSLLSSGNCLLAGEVRLAALKKASKGSSKLSGFTQSMTKTKGF
jgi:hypothetical protein